LEEEVGEIARRSTDNSKVSLSQGRRRDQAAPNASLMRIMEFLEWNDQFVESLETELVGLAKATAQDQRSVGRWWTIFSMK